MDGATTMEEDMYDNISIGSTKEARSGDKLDQKSMKLKTNSENGIIGISDTDTDTDEQGWTTINASGGRKPKTTTMERAIIDSIITTINVATKTVKNGAIEVRIESPVRNNRCIIPDDASYNMTKQLMKQVPTTEEEEEEEEGEDKNEEEEEEEEEKNRMDVNRNNDTKKKKNENNRRNTANGIEIELDLNRQNHSEQRLTPPRIEEKKQEDDKEDKEEDKEERIVTMANEQAGDSENRRLATERATDDQMQEDGNDTENTTGSEGNNGNNTSGNSGNNGNNDGNNNNNNDNSNSNNNTNRKRGGRATVSIVEPTDMATYTFTIAWRPENKAGKDGKIIIKNVMREMQHREPTIIFHPTNSATSPVPRDIRNINNDFPKTPATFDDFFDQNRNRDNTNQQTFMKVSMPHNEKELQNKIHNYLYHNQLYMNSPFINDNTLEHVGFVEKGHSRLVFKPAMEKKIQNGIKDIMKWSVCTHK
ncbi:hypothetical protein FRACYDRAFT_256355 [Fragilariopsis cylindrus CCMP1102]|uniref:Uncharacterized protein n=1 Tax=Fragilariopsis cylindrus CCMP1102 TaxID=635003 RepID=A0A1E7EJS7_9STRA|nr:hypothetical protein FRACYDRAFT_256355 [Fragilariopsis cylindrus CCMP1102]|eukprot:OEU06122.1 hypothetical protein FRACYDRAFT_256355 [Fragilariopsis cylindrus CCMP1102]